MPMHGTSWTRRELVRIGAGFAVGAGLFPPANRSTSAAVPRPERGPREGRAKSCILVYLLGGPPHLDMFDLKPHAPAEVRGPFLPIASSVPGMEVCELLPRLAQGAHRYALVRSVSHPNANHTPMIYYTLTGRETAQPLVDNDIRPPQPDDFPHLGSVLSALSEGKSSGALPPFVAVPEVAIRSSISGEFKRARSPLRGGGSGFLGPRHAALAVNGAPGTPEAVPDLALPADVSESRFARRAALLELLDSTAPAARRARTALELREQAVLLTGSSSPSGRSVFRLDGEPPAMHARYGVHRFGQAMLLARRLAEAGVRLVAIHFNEMTVCDGWDTHSNNFDACRQELLPMLDQSLSALLEDLDERGMLDEVIVACFGEFGRTPRINANAGRDHWGSCSSALLAGGGVRGGHVVGASDAQAAYPTTPPVDPVDLHATIYHALGVDPHARIVDALGRPWEICTGRVLTELGG